MNTSEDDKELFEKLCERDDFKAICQQIEPILSKCTDYINESLFNKNTFEVDGIAYKVNISSTGIGFHLLTGNKKFKRN